MSASSVVPLSLRAIPDRWLRQVQERRLLTAVDPAADALEKAAKELALEISSIEDGTKRLTSAEYATSRGVQATTVRRWCAAGLIAGAERDTSGDWTIPANARAPRAVRRSA